MFLRIINYVKKNKKTFKYVVSQLANLHLPFMLLFPNTCKYITIVILDKCGDWPGSHVKGFADDRALQTSRISYCQKQVVEKDRTVPKPPDFISWPLSYFSF